MLVRVSPFLIALLFLVSCNSVRRTEQDINSGNFDTAIFRAVDNLRNNKDAKRKEDYVILLEKAYKKAVEQDRITLKRLNADPNPSVLETIYEMYVNMEHRQAKIRPLLPLTFYSTGKQARFDFQDYSQEILSSRRELSNHLLEQAREQLLTATDFEARQIYEDLLYLNEINPNFKDVRELTQEALEKGTDFILVKLTNDTQQVIPERLEEELLNFSTFGLNNDWTVYHVKPQPQISYDYDLDIIFRNITISPDLVVLKELQKESQIKDGFVYELDARGNVKKDSLGNDIKEDKFKTVSARVIQNTQNKEAVIDANVLLQDQRSGQLVDRFPLTSGYVFSYIYGRVEGDRRALEDEYLETLNPEAVPFPTDEQLIYNAGEDLKLQLKQIISGLRLNR
ncbi:MAG: hypothetical protein WBG46_07130 [Nonlabens sp.]